MWEVWRVGGTLRCARSVLTTCKYALSSPSTYFMALKLEKLRAKKSAPEWSAAIYRLRQSKGWSQNALAKRLEVAPTTIARWESGLSEPDKWHYLQMLLIAEDPERASFEGMLGRTRDEIVRNLSPAEGAPVERAEPGKPRSLGPSPFTRKQRAELRDQAHTAIDLIFDRAPDEILKDISRLVLDRAGKFARASRTGDE